MGIHSGHWVYPLWGVGWVYSTDLCIPISRIGYTHSGVLGTLHSVGSEHLVYTQTRLVCIVCIPIGLAVYTLPTLGVPTVGRWLGILAGTSVYTYKPNWVYTLWCAGYTLFGWE